MEKIRNQLKALSRQYNFYRKNRLRVRNNLLWLMSQAFPLTTQNIDTTQNKQLNLNWLNFIRQFWHTETILGMNFEGFNYSYKKWCITHGVEYKKEQAEAIFEAIQTDQSKLPCDKHTKFLIENTIDQLENLKNIQEVLEEELINVSRKIPEYETVIQMSGVDPINAAILIAEIGDISRFDKRTAITAFAGIDPNSLRSNKEIHSASRSSKQDLKKALYEVIDQILVEEPQDDAVYQFMLKKREEGKSEPVYKTAGTNKFLRIYYGKIKAFNNSDK